MIGYIWVIEKSLISRIEATWILQWHYESGSGKDVEISITEKKLWDS